ncbi:hypothetical protein H6P81_005529 [Aristolochia fimbriata]|uniref:AAA+ ATPase domain-containing protein n=1 Tax=Aristolochia fimbriata TaxID=158543 RepID=A0AAV7EUQ7_ARIFI|nr:hypothetical protein H6P81_005529 [Aristolochia fimbriata]
MNLFMVVGAILGGLVVVFRIVFLWSVLVNLVRRWWGLMEEWCYVYQFYRIPEHNENFQENQLYRRVSLYLCSLASLEDSDYANLFAGKKPNEIFLQLDPDQVVRDSFLGAKVSWRNESSGGGRKSFVLRIRKQDKRRILRPYLQHIQTVADEIELKKREVKLFTNAGAGASGRWRSVSFTHPATLDTIAMDADLKGKVRSDLESFAKGKQYYHRLGRVWKRSYLLYGPAGTGKTSFVAAMAKFLCYDLYEVDLGRVKDDSDLKSLLLQTSGKSVILVEDLDRFLAEKSGSVTLSGILNFTDGVFSCCGEERVMVFTMNNREKVDPSLLRPGRLDVHIYFPLCDFPAFKTLATSYLGVKDHKLFPQVEEVFQAGGSMSPAEIGEILMVNRSSPSRALKSVINALQSSSSGAAAAGGAGSKTVRRLSESGSVNGRSDDSGDSSTVLCRESVHTREPEKRDVRSRQQQQQQGGFVTRRSTAPRQSRVARRNRNIRVWKESVASRESRTGVVAWESGEDFAQGHGALRDAAYVARTESPRGSGCKSRGEGRVGKKGQKKGVGDNETSVWNLACPAGWPVRWDQSPTELIIGHDVDPSAPRSWSN